MQATALQSTGCWEAGVAVNAPALSPLPVRYVCQAADSEFRAEAMPGGFCYLFTYFTQGALGVSTLFPQGSSTPSMTSTSPCPPLPSAICPLPSALAVVWAIPSRQIAQESSFVFQEPQSHQTDRKEGPPATGPSPPR